MVPRKEALRIADEALVECVTILGLDKKSFSRDARTWLRQRHFDEPSHIKRAVFFAAMVAQGEKIERGHFPMRFPRDHEAFTNAQIADIGLAELVRQKFAHFLNRVGDQEIEGVYNYVLHQVESSIFELAWSRSGASQAKMARLLGIHRNTVRQKLKQLEII